MWILSICIIKSHGTLVQKTYMYALSLCPQQLACFQTHPYLPYSLFMLCMLLFSSNVCLLLLKYNKFPGLIYLTKSICLHNFKALQNLILPRSIVTPIQGVSNRFMDTWAVKYEIFKPFLKYKFLFKQHKKEIGTEKISENLLITFKRIRDSVKTETPKPQDCIKGVWV